MTWIYNEIDLGCCLQHLESMLLDQEKIVVRLFNTGRHDSIESASKVGKELKDLGHKIDQMLDFIYLRWGLHGIKKVEEIAVKSFFTTYGTQEESNE